MKKLILLMLILLVPAFVCSESFYTVIIVNPTTEECKVLESYSEDLDPYVPEAWEKLEINQTECFEVVEKLKEKDDFDQNIVDYLNLLNCSKESTVKSISTLGFGAEEVCKIAGHDFNSERFVVEKKPEGIEISKTKKDSFFKSPFFVAGMIIIIIIIFLFLIIRKKRKMFLNR